MTIFEKNPQIGGLWPVSRSETVPGLVHPEMCTNQSRHTVSFSGLAWPEDAASFPKAWEVGDYLEKYRQRYCTDAELHLAEKVVEVTSLPGNEPRDNCRWKVRTQRSSSPSTSGQGTLHEKDLSEFQFDHVIVASGFFGKPNVPLHGNTYPVIHSSQFRDIRNLLFKDDGSRRPGIKIIVAGGQMSGVETAAAIAQQLSSAAHSPDNRGIQDAGDITVHHIVQNPFWVMPLFLPNNPMLESDSGKDVKKVGPNYSITILSDSVFLACFTYLCSL